MITRLPRAVEGERRKCISIRCWNPLVQPIHRYTESNSHAINCLR